MDGTKTYIFGNDGNDRGINPALLALLNQNGGFGNGAAWLMPMFLYMMFPWLFGGMNGGFGGFGGFGGNGGSVLGAGYLANLMNNNQATDTLLQAINGRADAASQLAQLTHSNINQVNNAISSIQSALATVGGNVGLTGQQVINSVQQGNMSLSQQLCKCCCDNQLAIANQTADLQQGIFGAQTSLNEAITRNGFAGQMQTSDLRHSIDMMGAGDNLAICQQTNDLTTKGTANTQRIVDAIADLKATNIKEFCDIREREMQAKINTQGDIITQLRGQLDNDRQTSQLNAVLNPLIAKVNEIASKQPNTIPVQYPNVVAVNTTPFTGGCGCNGGCNSGCGGNNFFA